jgi:hypothetical protein
MVTKSYTKKLQIKFLLKLDRILLLKSNLKLKNSLAAAPSRTKEIISLSLIT